MRRRQFIAGSLATGAGVLLSGGLSAAESKSQPETKKGESLMGFQQPELPYSLDALQPFLSKEQMTYHYEKHQAAYFKNLNGLVEGKPEAEMTLKELIVKAQGPLFNNASQAWNHTFLWNSMKPKGGAAPKGALATAIDRDFGNLKDFQKQFSDAAVKLFGSGWAWLACDNKGKLEIMPLSNAGNPLTTQKEPLLVLDVWEHAYYIDYRNDRAKYVEAFWTVANWDFATENYGKMVK
jgi:superoxide dismutase, Fe-Mn family